MDCEKEFIRLYNNYEITVRKIRQKLNISHNEFYNIRTKLVAEGKIKPRPFKRPKRKRHQPVYYSYSHCSDDFKVWRNGNYYGTVKTLNQAKRFVDLLKEHDWDIRLKDELKQQALKEFPKNNNYYIGGEYY